MIRATFRPMVNYPGVRTPEHERKSHNFTSTWSDTLDLLDRELDKLDADRVVIEAAFNHGQIRNDGWPRAGSIPSDDAIVLSFQSIHGPLRYMTDVFTGGGWSKRYPLRGWQANIRAIALGLEALRKVDRYGITKRGEQYTGWRALNAPGTSVDHPEQTIMAWADPEGNLIWSELSLDGKRGAVREAKRRSHPDVGGSDEAFVAVSQAAATLGF